MNLWFRLFLMLITVWRRTSIAPLGESSIHMTVLPSDLDLNGHMNNSRYLALADVARMDHLIRCGLAGFVWSRRVVPVMGDACIKFRKELRSFQRFEVTTQVVGWDEKWIFLEHRMIRRGRVCAVIGVRGLFKGRNGLVQPAELVKMLDLPIEPPALPHWFAQWHQSADVIAGLLKLEEAEPNASPV